MNYNSIRTVDLSIFSSKFRKPCYNSYCFSGIPGLIAKLFGLNPISESLPIDVLGDFNSEIKHVVVIFLDALGWGFIEQRLENSKLLKELNTNGVISKITSQFPSTTAAHVTTLVTGLSVGEHGVYEWNIYDPTVGAIIRSLPFSLVNHDARDTLLTDGYSPKILIPGMTLSEYLVRAGIEVNIFQDTSIALSAYSKTAYNFGNSIPFKDFEKALKEIADTISRSDSRSYSQIYFDRIDSAGHHHGPQSKILSDTIDNTLKVIDRVLQNYYIGNVNQTALFIISDHGLASINPEKTIYLNKIVPQLDEWILKDKNDSALVPAGSPRDFFLHLDNRHLEEAKIKLSSALEGVGEVFLVDELINKGFFGDPSKTELLRSRVGDIVALPYDGESFWWAGMKRSILRDNGFHGGLTPVEMDIPFIFYPL